MNTAQHNHKSCINDALEYAQEICSERGSRLTPVRKRVLEFIWENHEAVKAYDLLDKLAQEDASAKPPTIYRALDFLIEHGLIHKVESLNAYVGCSQHTEHHNFQLLICDKCGFVEEHAVASINRAIDKLAAHSHFELRQQTVELHGICDDCRNRAG